jgi:hypothetical protein
MYDRLLAVPTPETLHPHEAQSCRPSLGGGLDRALPPSGAAPHWYDSSSPQLIVALRVLAARAATALGLVVVEPRTATLTESFAFELESHAHCCGTCLTVLSGKSRQVHVALRS